MDQDLRALERAALAGGDAATWTQLDRAFERAGRLPHERIRTLLGGRHLPEVRRLIARIDAAHAHEPFSEARVAWKTSLPSRESVRSWYASPFGLVGCSSRRAFVLATETGEPRFEVEQEYAHSGVVDDVLILQGPGSKRLGTRSSDRTFDAFDLETGEKLWTFRPSGGLGFAADSQLLLTATGSSVFGHVFQDPRRAPELAWKYAEKRRKVGVHSILPGFAVLAWLGAHGLFPRRDPGEPVAGDSAPPGTARGQLIVPGFAVARANDGETAWSWEAGADDFPFVFRTAASPPTVIVLSRSRLVAFDASTGKPRWQKPPSGFALVLDRIRVGATMCSLETGEPVEARQESFLPELAATPVDLPSFSKYRSTRALYFVGHPNTVVALQRPADLGGT